MDLIWTFKVISLQPAPFSVSYIATCCATDFVLYAQIEWNITDLCHIQVLQIGF